MLTKNNSIITLILTKTSQKVEKMIRPFPFMKKLNGLIEHFINSKQKLFFLQYFLFRMEELISKMEEFQNLHSAIKSWCVQISIEQPKIMSYSLERVSKLYDNYLQKYGSKKKNLCQKENLFEPVWFQNELILFQWAVISYSLCNRIYVRDFTKSEIEFFSTIFRQKEFYIIDYEIKCILIKGKQIRNGWKIEEQKMLSSIIKQMPEKNKWNQIARKLYKVSGGLYFRQGKHCRERWVSYMQNRNNKKNWDVEEDIELLQLVSVIGKNWSQVANKFKISQSRTFLKKRFKILTDEVKTKFQHSISDKQAIQLLLHENYLKFTSEKKQYLLKNKKTHLLTRKSESFLPYIEGKIQNSNFQIEQSQSLIESKSNQFDDQDNAQIKSKVQQENQNCGVLAGGIDQKNWMVFSSPIQIFTGVYSNQYIPLQIYPQNCLVPDPNLLQSLNWWPITIPYQAGEHHLFY